MAPVVMPRKHPYTELETALLPCLLKLTLTFCTEEKNVCKVRKIPLLHIRTKHRYLHNSEDLLKQLFDKLKKVQLFGIKLDETIDVSDEGQLILYCNIADDETKPFRVLLVLCERVCATIQDIFAKLNQFMDKA